MAKTKIERTFLSTNPTQNGQPPLAGGFNEFATGRIPVLGGNFSVDFYNASASVGGFKVGSRSWAQLYYGISGPSWATACCLEGEYDENGIALQLSGVDGFGTTQLNGASYTTAGLIMGLGVTVNLTMTLTALTGWYGETSCSDAWHCHTNWYPIWTQLGGIAFSANIDLIDLIIQLVGQLAGGGADKGAAGESGTVWPTSNLGKGFQMYSSSFALHQTGNVWLNPRWSKTIDMIPSAGAMADLKAFLQNFGGGVVAGPVIGFEQWVNVALHDVQTGGHKYGNLQFQGDQTSGTITGTRVDVGTEEGRLALVYVAQTFFDFFVGFGISLSVLKMFSFGNQVTISVLSLLGIVPHTAPVVQVLVSDVATSPVPTVVLDPPARVG